MVSSLVCLSFVRLPFGRSIKLYVSGGAILGLAKRSRLELPNSTAVPCQAWTRANTALLS
jgi:hypothetical protein